MNYTGKETTEEQARSFVGKGWQPLLDICIAALPEGSVVHQIKEKFGGLRFYCTLTDDCPNPDEVYKVIAAAERLSFKTCEECGNPCEPKRSSRGWLYARCEDCWEVSDRNPGRTTEGDTHG